MFWYTEDGMVNGLEAFAAASAGEDPDSGGQSGTLTEYFLYTPYAFHDTDDGLDYAPGNSQDILGHAIPAPPAAPLTQSFVVSPTLRVGTSDNADCGGTQQATASIALPNETLTTGYAPQDLQGGHNHIVQVAVNDGLAAVSVSASAGAFADPTFCSPGGGVAAWSTVSALAWDTNRTLTLSSSLGQTYHKDPSTGVKTPDVPEPDGTLNLTTLGSYHNWNTVSDGIDPPSNVDDPFINTITFTPSFSGWNGVGDWSWTPDNSSDDENTGICQMWWGSIYYQDGVVQGQLSGSKTYAVSYTATDSEDAIAATANANVQLHDEWENKVDDSPATTLEEHRTYLLGTNGQPSGVSNNSGVMMNSPTMTGSITASLTLSVGFSPTFDVGWADKLGIPVNLSGTLGATLSITVPGPPLDPDWATYPFLLTTWHRNHYLVDHYTLYNIRIRCY